MAAKSCDQSSVPDELRMRKAAVVYLICTKTVVSQIEDFFSHLLQQESWISAAMGSDSSVNHTLSAEFV